MNCKTLLLIIFLGLLLACSAEEEGVLDTQVEALDKAKELEQSIQEAAEEQRKQLEQKTNYRS